LTEIRFIYGVEKVEHVRFSTSDQLWVRFNRPLDMQKLERIVRDRGFRLIRFGGLVAKLPRGLNEILWDGVTHVIVKEISDWGRLTSLLGFEPDGIGKIAIDLHGPNQIFMAMNESGIQLLYDYLGANYVPPPKPTVAPVKPATTLPKPSPSIQPASSTQTPPVATKRVVPPAQTSAAEKTMA
jgi:hypothetical protein